MKQEAISIEKDNCIECNGIGTIPGKNTKTGLPWECGECGGDGRQKEQVGTITHGGTKLERENARLKYLLTHAARHYLPSQGGESPGEAQARRRFLLEIDEALGLSKNLVRNRHLEAAETHQTDMKKKRDQKARASGDLLDEPVRKGFGVRITRKDGTHFLACGDGILPYVHVHRKWAVQKKRELRGHGFPCKVVPVLFTDPVDIANVASQRSLPGSEAGQQEKETNV